MNAGEGAPKTVTELSGTLEGVGLPAIVRFLSGLNKTGCLRVFDGDWHGELVFEAGQLTGASLDTRSGLSALDGLVQALPSGNFRFEASARTNSPRNIELGAEALQRHFDELVARIASGLASVPSPDAVPQLVAQDESPAAEEPLPLDRRMLTTLLAVDGQRTVREIVAQRGSMDALWQLGSLAEVGLVRLAGPPPPGFETALPVEASGGRAQLSDAELEGIVHHCPRLGFEDDPASSFDRPTRLHRCFAADTPLPLSMDHQRDLCLSDQFSTCPRLTSLRSDAARQPARDFRTAPASTGAARNVPADTGVPGPATAAARPAGRYDALRGEDEGDDPRIVRFAGRNVAAPRSAGGDRSAASSPEPTQPLSGGSGLRNGDLPRPTPLRSRIERASRVGSNMAAPIPAAIGASTPAAVPAPAQPAAAPAYGYNEPRAAPIRSAQPPPVQPRPAPTQAGEGTWQAGRGAPVPGPRGGWSRFSRVPVPILIGAAVVLATLALAVGAYLFLPSLASLVSSDSNDLSAMPNTSALVAGTPMAALQARLTPVPRVPSGAANASTAGAAAAPAEPTPAPEAASATAEPVLASPSPVVQPAASGPASSAAAEQSPAQPRVARAASSTTVLDEGFTNNARKWPSSPVGTAWLTNGGYHLIPRQAGQFVAVSAPIAELFQDVIVSATFRKLDDTPEGGGFGIIVRDQGPAPLDGLKQDGQYYVLEVGDKGEVGIWRRDVDHWVDLLAWQHADAVHPGIATNEMTVSAIGSRLSLSVNGTQVVTRTDATFSGGRVGLLVGGDGNHVAVDHLSIQTP